jgi:hypothetical protein
MEWLVEAANSTGPTAGRYNADEKQRAKHILHMCKLRLVHTADAVYLFMVDITPYEDM